MKMKFWFVTTDHLEDRIWFKDDEDFKAAMNIIAVLSTATGLKIVAFILMSNHVHFILSCERDAAGIFITRFKKMYSQYYSRKYGPCSFLHRNKVDIRPVFLDDEDFERRVAYVLMNSVAANICLHPSAYPWVTGGCYFRSGSGGSSRIGDFSERGRIRLLHSKLPVPDEYILDDRGFIDPASYVPVKFVESVFRTPKRMNWFLQNSSKAKRVGEAPSFNDQLMSAAIRDLSVSLFRKPGVMQLDDAQKAELFRQIRYRFSADPAQIARVCGVPYDEVCTLLESV